VSAFKQPDFADRQNASANAKKAALEKIKAEMAAKGPEIAKKLAEKQAQAAEREILKKQRAAEKAALAEQQKAEAAARAEEDEARRIRELDEMIAGEATLKAEQKALRDAKYAARKARQK
jgi:hypothetical protein